MSQSHDYINLFSNYLKKNSSLSIFLYFSYSLYIKFKSIEETNSE